MLEKSSTKMPPVVAYWSGKEKTESPPEAEVVFVMPLVVPYSI